LIAQEYVTKGHFGRVIEIIDANFNTKHDSSQRNNLFCCMISHFSQTGDFKQAIAYLKKMQSYRGPRSRECPNIVLGYAKKARNFAIVLEMLTEGVIPESDRISNILELIQMHIKEGEDQKARALVQQFPAEMDGIFPPIQRYALITVYVDLGYDQKAWDLAYAHQKDNHVFAVLRNAFTDKGLLAEAKKAESLIKL
jgi:pentatricopeptide repeat protein